MWKTHHFLICFRMGNHWFSTSMWVHRISLWVAKQLFLFLLFSLGPSTSGMVRYQTTSGQRPQHHFVFCFGFMDDITMGYYCDIIYDITKVFMGYCMRSSSFWGTPRPTHHRIFPTELGAARTADLVTWAHCQYNWLILQVKLPYQSISTYMHVSSPYLFVLTLEPTNPGRMNHLKWTKPSHSTYECLARAEHRFPMHKTHVKANNQIGLAYDGIWTYGIWVIHVTNINILNGNVANSVRCYQ